MTETKPLPLDLPPYTFLLGPDRQAKNDLALALCRLDRHLLPLDFEEPARECAMVLFYGHYRPDLIDLTETAERLKPLPIKIAGDPEEGPSTIGGWMQSFETWMDEADPTWRGQLALRNFRNNYVDAPIATRFIWRDAASRYDVKPFAREYGRDCLCIHLGSFDQAFGTQVSEAGPVLHIWLPEPSLEGRLAALRRELTPVR